MLRGTKVISPKEFYTDILELPSDVIAKQESFYGDESFQEMVKNYSRLEDTMRSAASREEE